MKISARAAVQLWCLSAWLLLTAGCSSSRQAVALGKAVPMGDGELTIARTEVSVVDDRLQLAVFFRWTGPSADLLSGFLGPKLKMTLTDGAGETYTPIRPKWSPIQPVPEETYGIMHNFDSYYESKGADKTFEADAVRNAERLEQLEAEIKTGRNPIAWVPSSSCLWAAAVWR